VSRYLCQPATAVINAVVSLPGSKSITNRALVIAGLADGTSVLRDILIADDTRLMIDALANLGIRITLDGHRLLAEVSGVGGRVGADEADVFCGNAGTVMRFGMAIAALGVGDFRFDGVDRMRKRPIGALARALQALGAGIEYQSDDGLPPLVVHASGLHGGHVSIDSPESSQMISALLMVAPYAAGDLFLEVTGAVPSVPYLKLTTAIMQKFGVAVVEQYDDSGAKFIVETPQRYQATNLAIEPDASNATYFWAAAAVTGGRVTVTGIGTDSLQGDARFVDVLERMGCRVERSVESLTVVGPAHPKRLAGIDVDLNAMPDTVQTLAVVALFADGPTTIRNVANLRVKETDRLTALRRELSKMGAAVEEFPDGLRITPPPTIHPAAIDTHGDHRMTMSFAVAGLKVPGLVINNPECCAKTFPDFFERFETMRSNDVFTR